MEVVAQADGTTLFVDYDNLYQLTLPQDWLAIPLTEEDMQAALDSAAQTNPEYATLAESFKGLDSSIFRLIALDTNQEVKSSSKPTFLMIYCVDDPLASSMPMAAVTAMIEDNVLTDATIISWDARTNSNGVEVGINDASQYMTMPSGDNVNVRVKIISFQANQRLILVHILTPIEYGDQVLPPMESIIETIKVTGK